jgi:glycosyltransferase involved in cell wall biosynthesis
MISIITPTHRPCPLLDLTIKSVLCQEYTDWEWVILDNSPDFYFQGYLDNFFKSNPHLDNHNKEKIKIYNKHFSEDTPIGHLKNECVKLTTCKDNEYILLLDHDDFLSPNALYEIHKMDNKYPTAQFISADIMLMRYNVNEDKYYIYNHIEAFSSKVIELQNCYLEKKPIDIDIDDFHLHFDLDIYSLSKYMLVTYMSEEEIGSVNPKVIKLQMHPRCVKKWCYNLECFKFYEGNKYSEDCTQLTFMGMCMQGAYIDDVIYYYVFYSDESNATYNLVYNQEEKNTFQEMTNHVEEIIKRFQILYPNYTYMDKYMNKHELKYYNEIKEMFEKEKECNN